MASVDTWVSAWPWRKEAVWPERAMKNRPLASKEFRKERERDPPGIPRISRRDA